MTMFSMLVYESILIYDFAMNSTNSPITGWQHNVITSTSICWNVLSSNYDMFWSLLLLYQWLLTIRQWFLLFILDLTLTLLIRHIQSLFSDVVLINIWNIIISIWLHHCYLYMWLTWHLFFYFESIIIYSTLHIIWSISILKYTLLNIGWLHLHLLISTILSTVLL